MGYLYDVFRDAPASAGETLAIDGGKGQLTYANLLERADDIRKDLIRAGVTGRQRIGVADTLGIGLYPALLAVSALNCSAVAFLTESKGDARRLERLGVSAILTDERPEVVQVRGRGVGYVQQMTSPECYVLSTSGSTNASKDVAISDGNLASYAGHLKVQSRMQNTDRISQNFRPQFDAFYEVLLMAAIAGGTIVVPSGRENILIQQFCAQWDITVWNSVPSQIILAHRFRRIAEGSLKSVGLAIFGGEALSAHCVTLWRAAAPNATIVNSYGPSETTIAIAEHVLPPDLPLDGATVPIGAVLPHLEWDLAEPAGAPGELELCVRGPQVFGGYINPADNAGHFYTGQLGKERTPDEGPPAASDWYRTGDIVTAGPDGLVFQHRADHEVKVRGQRVDLAIVEAELQRHPGVSDARALVLDGAVCAAVEIAGQDIEHDGIDLSALRDYARPRTIVRVSALPRLPNGKCDLKSVEKLLRAGGA